MADCEILENPKLGPDVIKQNGRLRDTRKPQISPDCYVINYSGGLVVD